VPSHRLLCSLLQFFGLELHHLTPSGILHIAAFVNLCEAYMGIKPYFNLWNYFFHTGSNWARVWKWQFLEVWTFSSDLGIELTPTSTSQHPVLQTGGGSYCSF
jgi:hypothetical protein